MKRKVLYILGVIILNVCLNISLFTSKANAQDKNITVSLQVFYDQLSSYGQWIEDPKYGYVWMPDVEEDFRPYFTNGYWLMTEYGNTWVSSYPWGWAPFHYGRWLYNSLYGWIWIPGYEWGPAWVCWRHGNSHYGWAPLSPWFTVTVTFDAYDCPANWWVFIPKKHIYRHRHIYRPRNNDFLAGSTIINHTLTGSGIRTPYVTGPKADEVNTATRKRVTIYNIEHMRQPGTSVIDNKTIQVYRPEVSFVVQERLKPTPARTIRSLEPIDDKHPIPIEENHKKIIRNETPGSLPRVNREQHSNPQHTPAPRQQTNIPAKQRQQPAIDPQRKIQPQRQVKPAQTAPHEERPQIQQGSHEKR